MAVDVLSLRYFVSHYSLPATVRVISGCGQLEEGDEVTLESVRCVRGVEALLGRHGESLSLSFLPFHYDGRFEVLVAPHGQPWSHYREFTTAGDIIKSGMDLPVAIKAKSNWRGLTESDSIYQQDIFTSLSIKTDTNGRCYVQAINQRGMVVNLTESARGDFTTDLSDVLMRIEDIVKLFESKFPLRIRLRALSPGCEILSMIIGDTLVLHRVLSRQEVKVTGIGDAFNVVVDDSVDVMMIGHAQGSYININKHWSNPQETSAPDDTQDEEDYVPMVEPRGAAKVEQANDDDAYMLMRAISVDEMRQVLKKKYGEIQKLQSQLAQQNLVIQALTENSNSLEVKMKEEWSQNKELRASNEFMKKELQALRTEHKAALSLNAADKVKNLEDKVRQLEVDKDETASEVQSLYTEIDRQKKGNVELSVLRQENVHLQGNLKEQRDQNEELSAVNEFLMGELQALRQEQEKAPHLNEQLFLLRKENAHLKETLEDEQNHNEELKALSEFLKGELQTMCEQREAASCSDASDKISQEKGNQQLSLLRDENTHLKEKLMSLEKEKKTLLDLLEEAKQEKVLTPKPGDSSQLADEVFPPPPPPLVLVHYPNVSQVVHEGSLSPKPVRRQSQPVGGTPLTSPSPVPRPRGGGSKTSSTSTPPVPVRRNTKHDDLLSQKSGPPTPPRRRNMLTSNSSNT